MMLRHLLEDFPHIYIEGAELRLCEDEGSKEDWGGVYGLYPDGSGWRCPVVVHQIQI